MPRRRKSRQASEGAILAFGPRCVVCGTHVRDLHHADHDASNTIWENLYPVCPNQNQGLERPEAIRKANADDCDEHLNVSYLQRQAVKHSREMNCLQAYACYHMAAQIAGRVLQHRDRALESALLSLYALRPRVAGHWSLVERMIESELLPNCVLSAGQVPQRTERVYCR